jgi:ribokinase
VIVCLGDLMVDVFCEEDRPRRSHPGGKAANYAAMVRALGLPAAVIGGVGADPDGEHLLSVMRGLEIDVSGVDVRADAATGADFFENGIWRMERGANWKISPNHVRTILQRLRSMSPIDAVIVNQGVAATASEEAIRFVREHGIFLVLNLAPEAVEVERKIDLDLAPGAEIIVVNQVEAELLVEHLALDCVTTDPNDLVRTLFASLTPREFLVLTRGPGGATVAVRTEDGPAVFAVPPKGPIGVDLEHHIGAGDAMLGAIAALVAQQRAMAGELTVERIAQIVESGVDVATASLDYAGTMTGAVQEPHRFRALALGVRAGLTESKGAPCTKTSIG